MIAIAGGKGGCGKTTTTLGVARALRDAGIGTRAVDLDAGMPNLHRMADVDREPSLATLVGEDGVDDGSVDDGGAAGTDDAPIQRDPFGTQIVPAPAALDDLDVPAALDAIRPGEGVALLDCPAGAGPAATTPLREADAAILVTTNRPESVEDAAKTGRMARNLGVPVLGAVVSRAERVTRRIEAELGASRTIAMPHRRDPLADERVRECYGTIAAWIEDWQRESRGRTGTARTTVRSREPTGGPIDAQSGPARCPDCGGVRATRERGDDVAAGRDDRRARLRDDRRATDRRDRRSRRSPDHGDTRSSSRGGGAPRGPR